MNTVRLLCSRGLTLFTILLGMTLAAGAQTGPRILVTPDTLDFLQVAGGKFAVGSFTIINTGIGTLQGSVQSNGGVFQVLSGGGNFSLGAGQATVVTLRFTPSSQRLFSDSIMITHNAQGTVSPTYVYLAGTGVAPQGQSSDSVEIQIQPATVNFGTVRIGTSAMGSVTITNASDSAVLVGTTVGAFASGSSAFSVQSGLGAFNLRAGESRVLTVAYTPTVAGTVSDSMMVLYNTSVGMDTAWIRVAGTAVASAITDVQIQVQPQVAYFGNVALGTSSQRQITLTNTSDSATAVGVIGVSTNGAFSIESGAGPFTLAPGASTTITVNFVPIATGVVSDSIQIAVNGQTEPTTIHLVGVGVQARPGQTIVGIAPTTVNFGAGLVGSTYTQTFGLTNLSSTDTLRATLISPSIPFYLEGGVGTIVLAPGQTRTYTATFTPTFAGSFTDNILIAYTAGDSTGIAMIGLSGSATAIASGIRTEDDAKLAMVSYPQPVIASSTLRFVTAEAAHVSVALINAHGDNVAQLVNERRGAGEQSVTWDATGVPSGVYLYQVRIGGRIYTHRFVVSH